MTPRELFEQLHARFMLELERHHRRKPAVADLVRIIGKHRSKSDNAIYGRYLNANPKKRQTPRVEEMQRMCAAWTAAGYRRVSVDLSLTVDDAAPALAGQ